MTVDYSRLVIESFETIDVRFPTSLEQAGSDAVGAPNYSAAYVILRTSDPGLAGHGLMFTCGRGTEICVKAVDAAASLVVGKSMAEILDNMRTFWRGLTYESQLRWLGPERGIMHMAAGAVVNALWDLYARAEGKPLWKLLADMPAEDLVACIDFRYIDDALTPDEAVALIKSNDSTADRREREMLETGHPAYTTSAGWLGYDDDKTRRLCRAGMKAGWTHFKVKVGVNIDDDRRRCAIVRQTIGPDMTMMVDANAVWSVDEAIANMKQLAEFNPWWIEEPTSSDDVMGHARIARAIAPIGVATGETCQNRIIFKQLLQADALRFCQLDSTRVGGVNELLAIMLLARKFHVPVCPHAGGVGLCEYVNHLIMADYIRIAADMTNRIAEYVDHLHEHFVNPVVMNGTNYMPPTAPGYSIEMKRESLEQYRYPDGPVWSGLRARGVMP